MPEITCPSCGERLDVPVELLGQTIRCGACQGVFEAGIAPPPTARPAPPRPRNDAGDEPRFNDDPPPKKRSLTWLWLLLGFGALSCAGCCGLLGYLGYKVENPTWTRFSPPDGRFTVEFPGDPPQTQTRPIPLGDETKPLTMSIFISERRLAQERYAVGVCDLPKVDGMLAKIAAEVYLEAALTAFKNQPGVKVTEVRRSNITLFGQPGREFVGTFSDSTIRNGRVTRRLFILDGRIYMLSAMGKDDGPSAAKLEHFFSSFTPVDPPKK